MPFIIATTNETPTPDAYDTHRAAPYWMPAMSSGVVLTQITPATDAWLDSQRNTMRLLEDPHADTYRHVLKRIITSNMELGLRDNARVMSSAHAEFVVYMPLIDRVMIESRFDDGLIRTEIYTTSASPVSNSDYRMWRSDFALAWRYGDMNALNDLKQYTPSYVDGSIRSTMPSYDVFLFGDREPSSTTQQSSYDSSTDSSNNNQPQEVTMQNETTLRAPLPNEFSTRIEQGNRMMDRLKHAVMVLAAHQVHCNTSLIPTGEYPESEIKAAKRTLDRFFNAVAVGVPNFDSKPNQEERVRDMIFEIQNDVRVRYERTDFSRLDYPYFQLRDLFPNVRDAVRAIIHEYLASVTEQSGYGLFCMQYAFAHGVLRSADNLRINAMRERINVIYHEACNDEGDVNDFLSDRGIIQCSDCGEWESEDRSRTPYNYDESVCRVCLDRHYTYSNYYDDYVHNDDARSAFDECGDRVTIHYEDEDFAYDDERDAVYHVNYEHRNDLIASYHSTKRHGFKYIESDWVKRNDRFIGIELEVECRESKYDAVERLNDALNEGRMGSKVWFENDGSLSDSGFEMITNPMGLDTHANFWLWLQDKSLTRTLRSHDTSTCGLHIHVSRKNLHDLQLNRMNVFINHPDNQPLVKAVARRYATNYARIREKQMGKAHYAVDRYDALNLENDETVEFRIFKGTLKHESLMAAIEFANAVVNFTNPASPAGFNLSTERFMRFIAHDSQRSETRHLRSYLKEAGFAV